MKVTKRNGNSEEINLDKIHKVLDWAAEGLSNVSVSSVELRANMQFFDGIETTTIHEALIKSTADLISEETPEYQYFAARLAIFHLRKKAFGDYQPPSLLHHVKEKIAIGVYDKSITEKYSDDEINELGDYLDHERDKNFSYAAVKQLEGKYLVQNRVTGQIHESPQILYMLIAACLFESYPKDTRLGYVKRFYDATSLLKISLPTPIMAGVRTPTRQFSSCVVIEADDNLDGINAATSSIVKYVSMRAGIGINAGMIRSIGSPIRGGEAFHTGCIPFFKHFQTAVKSCSQGGVRGGAATLFYPMWHLEVESLLVLKNNRGVEENRVRHLDYGVQLNRLMYQRLIKGGDITLFSPSDVPGLYDAFFSDQKEFERLYLKYEQDPSIRKKTIKAVELFGQLAAERASTGRIYIQHVDHSNTHSSFDEQVAPIRLSNLCLEITLPTKPLKDVNDPDGEIALCTLLAFNLGEINDLSDFKDLSDLAVRALDNLLDYQSYPMPAAERSTKGRRSLGVGTTNFAHYLAKNGVRYSDGSANKLTHETFEAIQYYMISASSNLAEEKGACDYYDQTKYSKGIFPIDSYKRELDEYFTTDLIQDWDELRGKVARTGLRNSTLTCQMPCETSSQITNSTNGIEPPRGFVSVKLSKDGVLRQVVPNFAKLKDNYELLWDIPNNEGYLTLVGIMQKFMDQSISANTNYDPVKFENGRVPVKVILRDMLLSHKLGVKTLYYHNTRDNAGNDESDDDGCAGGACKI
jgi:ribonucleoside-diphosphate reductase alpha chain